MSDIKPCKHLDYSVESYGESCDLSTTERYGAPVRFWHRKHAPPGAVRCVQFCGQGRGRINSVLACYTGENPCEHCYEPAPITMTEDKPHE